METNVATLLLQMAPLNVVFDRIHSIPGWPTIETQDCVIQEIDRLTSKFPPSTKYMRSFVRKLSREVRDRIELTAGVGDILAEYIIKSHCSRRTVEDDIDDNVESFHTLPLPNGGFVPLRVLRCHNQVGMKVWEAGLFLAELCIRCAPEVLASKTIIELGAGVGCTTITAVKAAVDTQYLPKRLILTEGPDEVVANLEFNAKNNALYDGLLINRGSESESDDHILSQEGIDGFQSHPKSSQGEDNLCLLEDRRLRRLSTSVTYARLNFQSSDYV